MPESIADLIDRLLASAKVSGDTRSDLADFKTQLERGALDPADQRYVEALGQRLLGVGPGPVGLDESAAAEEASTSGLWDLGDDPEIAALRQCLDAAADALRQGLDSEDPTALRVAATAALGIIEGGRSPQ